MSKCRPSGSFSPQLGQNILVVRLWWLITQALTIVAELTLEKFYCQFDTIFLLDMWGFYQLMQSMGGSLLDLDPHVNLLMR